MKRFALACLVAGCASNPVLPTFDLGGGFDLGGVVTIGPQPGQLGAPCTGNAACSSGTCLPIGRCSQSCATPADCPQSSSWTCAPSGAGSSCQCAPSGPEVCDGVDNDCDGLVDDNATCPDVGAVCMAGQCQCVTPTGSTHERFVVDRVTVPMTSHDFAIDLNGDGRPDNQYGAIVGALTAQGAHPQDDVAQAIAAGQALLLVDSQWSSSGFTMEACGGATVVRALPTASPPAFDGQDRLTVDNTAQAGLFAGRDTLSEFKSLQPATSATPVQVSVWLDVGYGVIAVPLVGAYVQFTLGGKGLVAGQINGAVKKSDIDNVLVPNLAASLSRSVQTNPGSSTSQQILQVFDTGGAADPACGMTCKNGDGTCAVAGDGVISPCEVGTNDVIRNLLAPDVQLFDAAGHWHPNPLNTSKDSLSVGFAFEAAAASF